MGEGKKMSRKFRHIVRDKLHRLSRKMPFYGHLLKANDPATQQAVEQNLASDPAAVQHLARLRIVLAPLEADHTRTTHPTPHDKGWSERQRPNRAVRQGSEPASPSKGLSGSIRFVR